MATFDQSGLGISGAGETDGNCRFFDSRFLPPVSLPGNFPDCSVLKETVSGPFLLPVSLPGNFPDCGLLHFYEKRTIMDPVSGAKRNQ